MDYLVPQIRGLFECTQFFQYASSSRFLLGGQARGAKGTRMQAYAFPKTSSARNPIVIVRILIFLRLKVVLQAKPCKGGWCNLESCRCN